MDEEEVDVDAVVTGTKTEDDKLETVTVIYFKDKDAANTAWEKVQDYAEDKKDDNTDWVVTQVPGSGGALEWISPTGRRYVVQPERKVPVFRSARAGDASNAPF
jgi:hypothetical protein